MAKKYLDIKEKLCSLYLEDPIDVVIDKLKSLKEKYTKEGYYCIRIESVEVDYCYECGGQYDYVMKGIRKETDNERNIRLKNARGKREKNKEEQAKAEEEERKLYEKLKDKYE